MPSKYYLAIGINDYPDAPLQGCVNDANNWTRTLQTRGATGETLLNADATKQNIVDAFKAAVSRLRYRDTLVVPKSGHGSWIPDRDGDEPDGRDEVWIPYDYDQGHVISDDDIYEITSKKAYGSRIIILSDTCYSGTVNRFMHPMGREVLHDQEVIRESVRFLPPAHFLDGRQLGWAREAEQLPITRNISRTSSALLISGCAENEFSYDAWIDNSYNGAFSYFALKTLQNNPKNFNEWHKQIRAWLPREGVWDQSPELHGTWWQRSRTL